MQKVWRIGHRDLVKRGLNMKLKMKTIQRFEVDYYDFEQSAKLVTT